MGLFGHRSPTTLSDNVCSPEAQKIVRFETLLAVDISVLPPGNIGGLMGVLISDLAKYIGFWSAILLPGTIYLFAPPLLWWLYSPPISHKPVGSGPGNPSYPGHLLLPWWLEAIRTSWILGAYETIRYCTEQQPIRCPMEQPLCRGHRRLPRAGHIFHFTPIFFMDYGCLSIAGYALSTMLTTKGVPIDVINNSNLLAIALDIPFL